MANLQREVVAWFFFKYRIQQRPTNSYDLNGI